MQAIEFYFDPISPFAYLGSVQIERVAARLGREVDWKPVLIGVTVLKVMGLKPVPETPLKGPYMQQDAVRLAEYFDVPFRYHGLKGINALAALRAFLVLKQRDAALAKSFAQRIFDRLWVRGLNITAPEAVAEEASALGIDAQALLRDIETDHAKGALKQAVDAAIQKGVFGVPYFVVDGQAIWGVDRMWTVEHWARHHSWRHA
jgi:2-hydroxychromene-2-carboxylate isomerase